MPKLKNELVSDLISVLEAEYKFYRQLKEIALAKKDSLVASDAEDLSELLEEDSEVLNSLEELEEKRIQIVSQLTEIYEMNIEDIQYSELVEFLPAGKREQLDSIRENLLEIINELHDINEQNRLLVEESIKLNNFSFKVLSGIMEPESQTYSKDEKSKDNVRHILDRRA